MRKPDLSLKLDESPEVYLKQSTAPPPSPFKLLGFVTSVGYRPSYRIVLVTLRKTALCFLSYVFLYGAEPRMDR